MPGTAIKPAKKKVSAPGCAVPGRQTIGGFTRHSNEIPPGQRPKMRALAAAIVASHRSRPGCVPVRVVRIEGHADRDRVRESRQPGFEKRISVDRARRVERALRAAVGPKVAARITWHAVGLGSAALAVPRPRTEADRRRNRRVEVTLVPAQMGPRPQPQRPPSPQPPQPAPPPAPFCGGLPRTPPPAEIEELKEKVRAGLSLIPPGLRSGLKPPTAVRYLYRDEQTMANKMFASSLDYSKILVSDGLGFGGRPFTVAVTTGRGPVVIMLLGSTAKCWAGKPDASDLVHELVHAWQSQHHSNPKAFMVNSVTCQVRALAAVPGAKALASARALFAARASGVLNPLRLASIAQAAAAAEDVSAYAYMPGKPFGDYAAEQIAQQIEDQHRGVGRPTPGVDRVIAAAAPGAVVPENIASLSVTSFHAKSTPTVRFP